MHLQTLCGPLECGADTSAGKTCPTLWARRSSASAACEPRAHGGAGGGDTGSSSSGDTSGGSSSGAAGCSCDVAGGSGQRAPSHPRARGCGGAPGESAKAALSAGAAKGRSRTRFVSGEGRVMCFFVRLSCLALSLVALPSLQRLSEPGLASK